MSLIITSSSFSHNGIIPARHTCDGLDISPALTWTDIPDGTKSLVLIVDDPDAPDPAAPKRDTIKDKPILRPQPQNSSRRFW